MESFKAEHPERYDERPRRFYIRVPPRGLASNYKTDARLRIKILLAVVAIYTETAQSTAQYEPFSRLLLTMLIVTVVKQ